jgi:hypothetical protein
LNCQFSLFRNASAIKNPQIYQSILSTGSQDFTLLTEFHHIFGNGELHKLHDLTGFIMGANQTKTQKSVRLFSTYYDEFAERLNNANEEISGVRTVIDRS